MVRVVTTCAMVTGRGGPEVLDLVRVDTPTPRPREVRIAVAAAGVAFGDVMRRRGMLAPRRPFTPGYDVTGVVEDVGRDADRALIGRTVAAMMPKPGIGGYAQHVCVPAERLVEVPDGVDPADVVALGLNYITAYQLVHRFVPLRAGQRVLIHGAAGGVGSALLDIGRAAGLTMYGTASSGKHDFVRNYGATPIDYRGEDFVERMADLEPGGVDAIFDPIGGRHLARSYRALARRGTLVAFGVSGDIDRGLLGVAAGMLRLAALKLRPGRHVRLYLITMSRGTGWRHCRDDWATLLAMHRRNELSPVVGARIPFADVRRAHELIDGAKVTGKIVLTM
jgi:NADPH:quinone reductase